MIGSAPAPRLFVILNPVAGTGEPERVRHVLERVAATDGIHYTIYETTGDEDLGAVARQARMQDYSLIVCAGGDGTLSDVLDGMANSAIPLGILPVGTVNLVARELNVPLALEDACRLLVKCPCITHADLMRVNERIYISHVSLGIYSEITPLTSASPNRLRTLFAGLWRLLKTLRSRRTWEFDLTVDGQRQLVQASLVMIANVGAVGLGNLRWGPNIHPDDGAVDVCIVKTQTLRGYVELLWQPQQERPISRQIATFIRARKQVTISVDGPLPVRGDGDIVGESKASVDVLPHAVKIVVPRG